MQLMNKLKIIVKTRKFNNHTLVGNNCTFGPNSNCFNSKDKQNIIIGDHCDIHAILSVSGSGKIAIGNYTTIRGFSIIGALTEITIGDYVIISNNVSIYDNNNHPTSPQARKEMCISGFYSNLWNWEHSDSKGIIIKDNVWIGERSTILKGVTIGEGAIVGCGSVVTHDVEPFTIVAGNPAKLVKRLNYEE